VILIKTGLFFIFMVIAQILDVKSSRTIPKTLPKQESKDLDNFDGADDNKSKMDDCEGKTEVSFVD